jgi:DNA-binding transcriptional regulator YdaS (Cro superfamily)
VRERFDLYVEALGGVRAAARKLGVSPAYISQVLRRQAAPGPRVLNALGLRRTVEEVYVQRARAPRARAPHYTVAQLAELRVQLATSHDCGDWTEPFVPGATCALCGKEPCSTTLKATHHE